MLRYIIKVARERLREGAKKGVRERGEALDGGADEYRSLQRLEGIKKIGKVISSTASEGLRDARAQSKE
ncbi:hypothetical protein N7491_011321 [Penicillium cf. griseofulvum]|uniref:Uncharacterized protein n=1 Tax=Penicillium cf. griseofulvum TaxID=2972120 RepID=A0A9W9JM39_9EURO|nr:hypothetical protein N7472_004677 [Penicillium cf. griseofulvum]KAJ5416419.1 hypothetical protein N7491_011321 [Penicillium cf. griseofulvum]